MADVQETESEEGGGISPELGPRVLAVGGADPSGAAGIQADLRTYCRLGVFGTAATTAVTVQNQYGVTEVMPLSASLVRAQIEAVLQDSPCEVVKTGMLASLDTVHMLADLFQGLGASTRLIVDPVISSTTGRSLLPDDAIEALVERLVPMASLITPNIPEATRLTGVPIHSVEDMGLAIDHLLARGAGAVLLKGGHLLELDPNLEELTDILRTADGEETRLVRRRISGPSFRGTGCTLASAVAAKIAEGLTLQSAVLEARDYLESAMSEAAAPWRNVRALGFGNL